MRWWYHVDTLYAIYTHRFLGRQKWACKLGWHQRKYTPHKDRSHPIYCLDPDAIVWEKGCFRCDWDGGLHVW